MHPIQYSLFVTTSKPGRQYTDRHQHGDIYHADYKELGQPASAVKVKCCVLKRQDTGLSHCDGNNVSDCYKIQRSDNTLVKCLHIGLRHIGLGGSSATSGTGTSNR